MTISADDVRTIARLARLDLSDEEVERFVGELSKILDYVAQLEEVESGTAAEPEAPDSPLRPDAPEPWPDVEPLHEEAPEIEDGYVRVPRVIE
ncbi:MAG: Asp-tRNA(Asn)/Glu-tRNA(Gln) amidotransferase subunit GatC [Gemmatimonadota bacterium]|nr:Asp-tRNA(Asn)/Glu-tRNA(Gln) amidotransferase subunit GatC [Gemmatimonadota bacterium]